MSAPIRIECDICDQQIGRHPLNGIAIINLYDGKEQKYYCYDDIYKFLHSDIIFLAETQRSPRTPDNLFSTHVSKQKTQKKIFFIKKNHLLPATDFTAKDNIYVTSNFI